MHLHKKSCRSSLLRGRWTLLLAIICFSQATIVLSRAERATNVIIFIGDGMGFEHVKAGRYYKGSPLCFETWPYTGSVSTASADSQVTDSAAGATAIATGMRVNNGVISLQIPGKSNELQTVLEYFKAKGKRTGLVTTDLITGATPAAFGAHTTNRSDSVGITNDYLHQTHPNILYGGAGLSQDSAASAGYQVVTNRTTMLAINTSTATNISGQFGAGEIPYEYDGVGSLPHLWEMTSNALAVLDNGSAGFFVMVEGAKIDKASHASDTNRMVLEVLAFDTAVKAAMTWATNRNDTLILVTADHETGGLIVTNNNGISNYPGVLWTAPGVHTATNIGLWAWGAGAERVGGQMANTNTCNVMLNSSLLRSYCSAWTTTPTNASTVWLTSSGDVFRVDYTARLDEPQWTTLNTVTASSTTVSITDTNIWSITNRFYRVISLP
jgi:alkaline phosphatase